jgi:hypothetical protein
MNNIVFWDVSPCALVGTDVSEENIASIFRVKTMNERNTLEIASDCSTLRSVFLVC